MDIHHLVKMANQIGDFFAAYPNRDEVVKSIAIHIKNSWDPRMRRQLIQHAQGDGADLKPLVREAVLALDMPQAAGEAPGDD